MYIKEHNSEEEVLALFKVMSNHYKEMSFETYRSYVKEMVSNGYRAISVINDEGLTLGVAGFNISTLLYCGRYIQISSMIVEDKYRGMGVASMMLNWIEEYGRKNGCKKFVLDSYVTNHGSHKLYIKKGFEIKAYHFMKDL